MSTPSIGFVSSPLAGPGSVRPNGVAPPPPPRTTEAAPEPTDTLTSAAPSDLGLIQPGIAQAAAAVEGVPVSALREITEQAMTSRGLTTTFSPEALDQLARIPGPAPIDEPGVVDMRHLPWVSIDNESTRDIDQLAAAQDLGNGRTRLLVAIADVAAVVGKDSPLDRQAQQNTSTVYTPGTTMSMLPEQLSTDWTSLGPGVDRRAMVTELIVDKNGDVESSKVFQAAVNNHCKTDYNAVSGWLDGSRPEPRNIADQPAMDDQLRLQMDVGKRLGEAAHRRGALEFTTDRVTPVQKDGRIVGIEPEKKNLANEAVANMMIATNMANAKFLHDRGLPVLQRVVRPPERWDRMREVAAQEASHLPGGHEMPSEVAVLPSQPDPKALGHYMDEMHRLDPDRSNEVTMSLLKLMGGGDYVVAKAGEPLMGHFGQGVAGGDSGYLHSTAPNRRLPDIVTQRMIKAALENKPCPYSEAELESLAARCNTMESAANGAERQVQKAAVAEFLQTQIGHEYAAIVTGETKKGVFVKVTDPPLEGKLVAGHEGVDVGDRLDVRLVSVDPRKGFIDFGRVPPKEEAAPGATPTVLLAG